MESWRTHFEVLGLEGQVLGVEVSSPRNLPCPRLEDSTIFLNRKNVVGKRQKPRGKFAKPFFVFLFRRSLKKIFCRPFFFFFCGNRMKNFIEDLFFFANTCACVFGPWPWSRAFLSSASRGSVLGRAVFFFVIFLFPWPRAFVEWKIKAVAWFITQP